MSSNFSNNPGFVQHFTTFGVFDASAASSYNNKVTLFSVQHD